jgi:hypothetical protein
MQTGLRLGADHRQERRISAQAMKIAANACASGFAFQEKPIAAARMLAIEAQSAISCPEPVVRNTVSSRCVCPIVSDGAHDES